MTYSTLINGVHKGWIQLQRGLRQGDPLSPYLFFLCAEVLSHMMRRAEAMSDIKGIKISNRSPPITHLLFTDDSLFFCQANEKSCRAVSNILLQYERASGQMVNKNKSAITFGKRLSDEDKTQMYTSDTQ